LVESKMFLENYIKWLFSTFIKLFSINIWKKKKYYVIIT
jgi:hypothetical protein